MRSRLALTILFMLTSGSVLAQDVNTEKGKLSYAVGWDIGADIARRSTEFDVESLITAIRDVVAEKEPQVVAEEMRTLLAALQEKVRAEQVEQFRVLSEKNQAESEAFLAANKSKTGIVALPSGVSTASSKKVKALVPAWKPKFQYTIVAQNWTDVNSTVRLLAEPRKNLL